MIKAGLEDLLNREPDEEEGKEKKEARKKNKEEKKDRGLYFNIQEGGKNLSSGEKQLICICRAIL